MGSLSIGDSQAYTISLDSVDLPFLRRYISYPLSDTRPLWTRTRPDGAWEYFQLQIGSQDDSEDCYSESVATYKCHICNIRVPTICYKDHNQSEQHETNKNISQKVLERVSKQIDIPNIINNENITNDMYFCVACSKIIRKENKDRHESTAYHVRSLKNISITGEFYKILKKSETDEEHDNTDDEIDEDSDIDSFKTLEKSEIEEGNDNRDDKIDEDSDIEPGSSKTFNRDTTNENFRNSLDSGDNSEQPPNSDNLNTENDIQPISNEITKNFEAYLTTMTKVHKLEVNLPVIDGENILIVAPNGDTVKVSRQHYQSYKPYDGMIYCQICKEFMTRDTRLHDVRETHVRNMLMPINENFDRSIDSVLSHCVPCNKLFVTVYENHERDNGHKSNIKDKRSNKNGKTFCNDCNIYIDTHNYAVHLTSNKHFNGIVKENCLRETTDNIFLCQICNKTMPKHSVSDHITSKMHKTKKAKREINSENNNSTVINVENNVSPKETGYCNVCKVKVPHGGMKIHVDGNPHKMDVVNKSINTNTENVRFADASRPTTSADSNLSNVVQKKNASYEFLEYTNAAKTEVRCKICFVNVVYNEKNIRQHMNSKEHIENNKKWMEMFNQLLSFADNAQTKVTCLICDVNITYNERNIIEHMQGRNHAAAENELFIYHTIIRQNTEYKCECCDHQITNYFEHINGKNHTLNFLERYEIDGSEMRKYVYDDNIKNSDASLLRLLYKNLLKYNAIIKINGQTFYSYYCSLCDVRMPKISEIQHVLGEKHRQVLTLSRSQSLG